MNYREQQLRLILKQHQTKWEKERDVLQNEHQQQLRKINILFDENAKNYKEIDFNGLYSLLKKIKVEREEKHK